MNAWIWISAILLLGLLWWRRKAKELETTLRYIDKALQEKERP